MENLKGRKTSGSNGTFLKSAVETGPRSGGCCSAVHGAAAVAPAADSATQDVWLTCGQQHVHNNNNNNNATTETKAQQGRGNVVVASGEPSNVAAAVSLVNSDASFAGNDGDGGGGSGGSDSCHSGGERIADNVGCRCECGDIDVGCGVAGIGVGVTGQSGVSGAEDSCTAGAMAQVNGRVEQTKTTLRNGATCTLSNACAAMQDVYSAAAATAAASSAAATPLLATPVEASACAFDIDGLAAASASAFSRSASLNNSTENLSFSSDNYYPDDLLLLGGDDDVDDEVDVEAEEISLNSDDCVYAYRGDGTDLELALDAIAGRGHGAGNVGMVDDETDFLEMDFEPDPLSEVEYGSVEPTPAHADAFLLQRDSCHLSGRHSATLGHYNPAIQRPLFSSPIDDGLPPPPPKSLQSQLILSKNFARITMHLDQIKGENGDCDVFEHVHGDRASVMGISDDAVDAVASTTATAHSLPNTLMSNFGRDIMHTKEEHKTTPSKVTGAKPKRFSTFSTSSSTSSKNSSKSRNSLRSTYALTTLCNSSSFDERSVSCTEFRCAAPRATDDCMRADASNVTVANDCDDLSANDETCLDCLEREFLANTIGKAIDLNECVRCRKRAGNSFASYRRAAQTATARCRSGSPLFFRAARDDCIFESANDYLSPHKVASSWTTPIKDKTWRSEEAQEVVASADKEVAGDVGRAGGDVDGGDGDVGGVGVSVAVSVGCVENEDNACKAGTKTKTRVRTRLRARTCDADVLQFKSADDGLNQRRTTGDSFDGEHLLKNLLLTEKETVTVPTLNLSEEMLVQALDKLHVTYNVELIKSHFKLYYTNTAITPAITCTSAASSHKHSKEFKDLKHFLLHESKHSCNHIKLKRLIELATRQQVEVRYKKDSNITELEMIPVKVADILHQWVRTKNLNVLKHLDKRFTTTNVLGKIANIIRQAQQRCTPRRPLPEYISIPQYYASGVLTLTKKC